MKRFLKIVFAIFICICSMNMPIHAEDMGSITIELQDSIDNLSKENVKFGVKKIASIANGKYVLCAEFESLGIDFNVEMNTDEFELVLDRISALNIEFEEIFITDKNGIAKKNNLDLGIYYVYPIDIHEYEVISPTLVSIPQWDEDEFVYDIKILPKHIPFPKFEIRKIDSKSKDIIEDLVEFTLYNDASCENKIKTLTGKGKIQVLCNESEFYIKETKAPSGYKMNSQTIKVSVKDNALYVDDKRVDSGYVFEFENKKESMPTSTQTNEYFYMLVVGVTGLIVLILWLVKKRRS